MAILLYVTSLVWSEWAEGPPLPEPRWHHAAAASNDGYVMVFGGRIEYGPERAYGHGVHKRALDFFDPTTQTWHRAAPIPPYRGRVMNHVYKKAVVDKAKAEGRAPDPPVEDSPMSVRYEMPFGGADALGRAHYFASRGSVYFDPRTRAWGQAQSPVFHIYPADKHTVAWSEGTRPSYGPGRSLGATATGPDGKLYLVGGMGAPIEKPRRDELLAGLDIYDPATNEWKRAAPMKNARQSLAAAFGGDGKLYVFGGCACYGSIPLYSPGNAAEKADAMAEAEGQKGAVAATEVYDPKTDTWSTAAPMRTPRMLFAAAPGADGKIYVIGGQTFWGGEPLAQVDIYNPATNRWSRGPELRIGRVGHTAVTTGDGTIWVVGGYAGRPSLTQVTRLMAGDRGGPTTSVELLATAPD